jgi:uncharacterized protein (DUF433 family)
VVLGRRPPTFERLWVRGVRLCPGNHQADEEVSVIDLYTTAMLTARETARSLKMPESTLDAWLAHSSGDPLVHAVEPEHRGWPRVPFVGVIEAYVLRSLRDLRLPMADIRRAVKIVREEFDDSYALARKRIATDGVGVFVRVADESIVQARDHQVAIREVIMAHLRYISWDDHGNPESLTLPQYPERAAVIIDPRFCWGAPVLAESKVPVEAMVRLWRTGESISDIAGEYGLDDPTVEDVLRQAS